MRYAILCLLAVSLSVLTGCNLGRGGTDDGLDGEQTITPVDPGGTPTVAIVSPSAGDEFLVNEPILISVTAQDSVGVTNVQLFANNTIARTVASESPTGDTNRSFLLDYTPRTEGNLELRVVANRGSVESEPASVTVVVRGSQRQITATPQPGGGPVINPNDPTCRALVNTGLNLRRGPSTDFDVIRVLGAGEVLPIIGRLGDNSWWQLTSSANIGWVDARFVTTYGNCTGIAVVSPPVSATPSPTPTLTPQNTSVPPTATVRPTNTVTPQPAVPNLVVTNINGPDTVTIPSGATSVTVTYSANITNQGGPVNQQFSNVVRVLPGGNQFDLGVVAGLGAGQTISLNVDIVFDTAGVFVLQFRADSDDDIDESNNVDNSAIFNVEVRGG